MEIGDKIYKNDNDFQNKFHEMAVWCVENRCYMKEHEDYWKITKCEEPSEEFILGNELNSLLKWFVWYDEQCMQYQRSVRLQSRWDGDIEELDAQAITNAKRISEIRRILSKEGNN